MTSKAPPAKAPPGKLTGPPPSLPTKKAPSGLPPKVPAHKMAPPMSRMPRSPSNASEEGNDPEPPRPVAAAPSPASKQQRPAKASNAGPALTRTRQLAATALSRSSRLRIFHHFLSRWKMHALRRRRNYRISLAMQVRSRDSLRRRYFHMWFTLTTAMDDRPGVQRFKRQYWQLRRGGRLDNTSSVLVESPPSRALPQPYGGNVGGPTMMMGASPSARRLMQLEQEVQLLREMRMYDGHAMAQQGSSFTLPSPTPTRRANGFDGEYVIDVATDQFRML